MIECPKCSATHIIGVQYAGGTTEAYDGISEYSCSKEVGGCGYRQGRWTGFELKEDPEGDWIELEPRYGLVTKRRNGKVKREAAGKPIKHWRQITE